MDRAAQSAERQAATERQQQQAYHSEIKQNWEDYIKSAEDNLQRSLDAAEEQLEEELAGLKERYLVIQQSKAQAIISRLVREVIALYGSSEDGKTDPDRS